jgi:hypothetical protein
MSEVYDEASDVSQKDGAIKVVGPDGVDVKLTPKAALKIAGRLDEAALDALVDKADADETTPSPASPTGRPSHA